MKMPGNMQAMMKQAQQMQEKMQAEIALIRVEGSAGGGMVTVKMDGHKIVTGVKIDPEVAGDVEMLQDLVVAACADAVKKVEEESQRKMGGMLGGMGLPPGGLFLEMPDFAEPLARLITEFKRLPGVGQKSAQRIAFHIMRSGRGDAAQLAEAILDVKDKLTMCVSCNNIADSELCQYCRDPQRDQTVVAVVEDPNNIVGIEVTRQFNGLYHVLGGALSPLRGIGPEQLRIKTLIERISKGDVKEVIVATNPTVEGEATSVYLSRLLKPLGVRVTRIAMGVPVGSDLEFADEVTIWKALEGRREI